MGAERWVFRVERRQGQRIDAVEYKRAVGRVDVQHALFSGAQDDTAGGGDQGNTGAAGQADNPGHSADDKGDLAAVAYNDVGQGSENINGRVPALPHGQ